MQSDLASVYGLRDTRDKKVFYIGMSTDPYARYGQHITLASKAQTAKDERILDMQRDGVLPELVIFEQGLSVEQASIRERFWIHYHIDLGIQLLNTQHTKHPLPGNGKVGRASNKLDHALRWIPWADAGFPIDKQCPYRNPREMKREKHRPKPEIELKARRILSSKVKSK